MAKRRKEKDEQEDKPFKIPKFDAEEFINKEKKNIKATFVAFLFGLLMAVICFGFWALMGNATDLRWPLVILVAIANAIFVRYVYEKLNLDIAHFTKKNWFTSYAIYFITWLLVFIVIVNPPFYDSETPLVEEVVLPDMQEFGQPVKIIAKITDNVGVEKSGISLKINGEAVDINDFEFEDKYFKYTHQSPENTSGDMEYDYVLEVTDKSGLNTIKEGSFKYSNNTIRLASQDSAYTEPGPSVSFGTPINFEVKADVTRVYYTVNDGQEINMTKQDNYWITYPKYEGWPKNSNVTVKVYAVKNYFYSIVLGSTTTQEEFDTKTKNISYNNTIEDSTQYYFQTRSDGIGEEDSPEGDVGGVGIIQVPGFETIIFIIALISIVLIIRYKKKDDKKKK